MSGRFAVPTSCVSSQQPNLFWLRQSPHRGGGPAFEPADGAAALDFRKPNDVLRDFALAEGVLFEGRNDWREQA